MPPRINAVRGPTEEEPDEDWSVILGSEPEGSDRELEGRFSGRGSRSLTSPVPYDYDPRGSRIPDDDRVSSGCGSRSLTSPVCDDPKGSRDTPDDEVDGDEGLGTTTVGGLRKRVGLVPKSPPYPNPVREGSRERGAISGQKASSSRADAGTNFFVARDEDERGLWCLCQTCR